jgi:hypothetical protein
MPSVYLAGPMLGTTKDQMLQWRLHAIKRFCPVIAFSPLRGFQHLLADDGHMPPGQEGHPLLDPQAFTRRDFWDVRRHDALLCNFMGATRVSIGSCMEIAVARERHKYITVVMEQNNIHRYSMILDSASLVVDHLDQGIELTKAALLHDYTPSW